MTRITITLNDEEKQALRSLSQTEYREPRAQAALIIRKELERQGLIKASSTGKEKPVQSISTRARSATVRA
jgi:hypothetical protein